MAFRVVEVKWAKVADQGWNIARADTLVSMLAKVPDWIQPTFALKLSVAPGVSPVRNPTAVDPDEPPNGAAPAAAYPVLPVDGAVTLKPSWNAPLEVT